MAEVLWDDTLPWDDTALWEHGSTVQAASIPVIEVDRRTALFDDYQFEIDGFIFGRGATVFVEDGTFEPGSVEWRTQDTDVAGGDGGVFGRDYISAPTWAWTLGVDRLTTAGALADMAELSKRWLGGRARRNPREVTTLRYQLNGRIRQVYGRPRNLAPTLDTRLTQGYAAYAADFKCADHLSYDANEQIVTIPLVAPYTGGFTVPAKMPWRSIRSLTSERRGAGVVRGDAETWPVIEIQGPISGGVLECVGRWRIELARTVAADQTLTIDTHPWARTVTMNDSTAGAGGFLGRRTRLSALYLAPGACQFLLTGSAATPGAVATVRWRDASHSL